MWPRCSIHSLWRCDRLAKLDSCGAGNKARQARRDESAPIHRRPESGRRMKKDPVVQRWVDMARPDRGHQTKPFGVHAAGVVIAAEPAR